jgi:hypothetical protein
LAQGQGPRGAGGTARGGGGVGGAELSLDERQPTISPQPTSATSTRSSCGRATTASNGCCTPGRASTGRAR